MKVSEALYWAKEFSDKDLDAEADMGLLFWEVNQLVSNDWSFWAFLNSV